MTGISFGAPGKDVAGQAMTALGQMHDRTMPFSYLIGDRAYFPGQKFGKLQLPVRGLGHKLIADYPINQLGVQESYAGAKLVEGTWYCPSMPEPLIDACIDDNAGDIDIDIDTDLDATISRSQVPPRPAIQDKEWQATYSLRNTIEGFNGIR